MSLIPQLLPVEKGAEKVKTTILENVVKMLLERGTIDLKHRKIMTNDKVSELIKSIISNIKDDDTCIIDVDRPNEGESNKFLLILLLDQKISTVTKSSVIGDYIYKNTGEHKIIIVNEITQRARISIQNSFPHIEIFLKDEMMFNTIDSIYVPKHELLSDEDTTKLLDEYKAQKKDLPRILIFDPIARYYNAKIWQIFRIKRPSETTGFSIYYRIVVRDISAKKSK